MAAYTGIDLSWVKPPLGETISSKAIPGKDTMHAANLGKGGLSSWRAHADTLQR